MTGFFTHAKAFAFPVTGPVFFIDTTGAAVSLTGDTSNGDNTGIDCPFGNPLCQAN